MYEKITVSAEFTQTDVTTEAKLIEYIINDDLIPRMISLGFPLAERSFAWDVGATYSCPFFRHFS